VRHFRRGTGNPATGNLTQCFTFTSSPTFSLSANPTSVPVQQGASGTTIITVAVSGGFSNAVTLSASGLPSGVIAGFNPSTIPAPGSGSSTLTLNASRSAATGTYSITITGTGGGVTQTTTVSLTVSAVGNPSFTLTANPSSVSVSQGGNGTTTITAAISGGFDGDITFSDSGLPSGVTASYNPSTIPAPGSGTSTLTLTASSNAAPGTYTAKVIGTGTGGVVENTTITLTVTGPSVNLIRNGGFETGDFTGWQTGGAFAPVVTTAEAHSGKYSALLGHTTAPEVNGNSHIYQTITIPSTANKVTLNFSYWPGTNDSIQYAWQEALIQDNSGNLLATAVKVANNARGWKEVIYDLTSHKGQTIRVYFAVHGNGYSPDYIYMYVDDVTVTVQ
jgi:hypothetical protein